MIKKIGNVVSLIFGAIGFLVVAWVVISWIEVFLNNTTPGYEYSALNFFSLLF